MDEGVRGACVELPPPSSPGLLVKEEAKHE